MMGSSLTPTLSAGLSASTDHNGRGARFSRSPAACTGWTVLCLCCRDLGRPVLAAILLSMGRRCGSHSAPLDFRSRRGEAMRSWIRSNWTSGAWGKRQVILAGLMSAALLSGVGSAAWLTFRAPLRYRTVLEGQEPTGPYLD